MLDTTISRLNQQLIIVNSLNEQLLEMFGSYVDDIQSSVEIQLTRNSVANLLYNIEAYGHSLSDRAESQKEKIEHLINKPIFDKLNIDIAINIFNTDNKETIYDDYLDLCYSDGDFADLEFASNYDPYVENIAYSCFIPLTGLPLSDARWDTYTNYPTVEEYNFADAIAGVIKKHFGLKIAPDAPKQIHHEDLQMIHDIITDKECKEQLAKLTSSALAADETIYLNLAKRGTTIEFLFDGYNFYWNSCYSKPFQKYKLPINYSLYDRSWRFNEIEPSGYCQRTLNKSDYNPYEDFRSFFAPALDNNYIYGWFEPAIVLNKGFIKKVQRKADRLYYLNDKGDIIATVHKDEVTNPGLLMQFINDLLVTIEIGA